MANYQHKRSAVAGKVPLATDLLDGEIAINIKDKKLFSKDDQGVVFEISGESGGVTSPVTSVAGKTGDVVISAIDVSPTTDRLWLSQAERLKLSGISSGAEANVVDSVAGRTGDIVLEASDVSPTTDRLWLSQDERQKIVTNEENIDKQNEYLKLKIFQSPTDGLTEIKTRTLLGGEVYEVRKVSDDSLATIYSDKEGDNEIGQSGTDNVSGSDGVVGFFVADGKYSIDYDSKSSIFIVSDGGISDLENGADITSLLQGADGGNVVLGNNNTYYVSSDIEFNNLPNIAGNNSEIILTNNANITSNSNRFISTSEVTLDATKGDKTITVSNIANFNLGDVFFIQNNVDFSFCGAREYYRDGDFCKITDINGNVLTLKDKLELDIVLDGGNPTKYQIHQLTQHKCKWSNLKITAEDGHTKTPVVIDGISIIMDNVDVTGKGGNTALAASAIWKSKTKFCNFTNLSENLADQGYGFTLRGGRYIEHYGTTFYSRRHASSITSGGDVGDLNTTPARDVNFYDCEFDSFGNVNNTHAVDGHGASDRVYYHNCITYAGVVMGGKNCYWNGGEIHSNDVQGGMYLREWVGGTFTFKPNIYYHNALGTSCVGHHSTLETSSPYSDVSVEVDCKVKVVKSLGSSAITLSWNTLDDLYISLYVSKMNFDGGFPSSSLVNIYNKDPSSDSYVKELKIARSNMTGGNRRWFDFLGDFISEDTRVSLPTVTINQDIPVNMTGKTNTTVSSPVRYPMSNVACKVTFYKVPDTGLVAGSSRGVLNDSGYYYYTPIVAQELTGDFTSSHNVPCVIEFVVDNIKPVE